MSELLNLLTRFLLIPSHPPYLLTRLLANPFTRLLEQPPHAHYQLTCQLVNLFTRLLKHPPHPQYLLTRQPVNSSTRQLNLTTCLLVNLSTRQLNIPLKKVEKPLLHSRTCPSCMQNTPFLGQEGHVLKRNI